MSGAPYKPRQKSFLRQHLLALIIGVLVLSTVGAFVFKALTGSKAAARPAPMITMISLPPAAASTPAATAAPEQKVQEQEAEPKPDEPKPKDEPPKPPEQPPAMGSNIKGDGNDGFGLSGNGNGGRVGGGGNGSRWSQYGRQVQSSISAALRSNRRTRSASMNVRVRVWPDANGRVERAELVGSAGDAELDRVIRDEVLAGLSIGEAPPADMPRPITLRLNASRPH